MGAVIDQSDRIVRLSIARLAEEFGMARETVSKRLAQANVVPDGKRFGYPVYRLRDACPALLDQGSNFDSENGDPKNLSPEKRRAWYQSEVYRLSAETTARRLIPADECESEQADIIKCIVQFLDTLGDQLERDCGLSPEQVSKVNESADRLRNILYQNVVAETDVRVSA